MKSIRLNKSLRAEIVENIATAYNMKNPRPEVPNPNAEFEEGIIALYRKESAALNKKLVKAGLDKCVTKRETFQYIKRDGGYHTIYLRNSEGKCDYITPVNAQGTWFSLKTGEEVNMSPEIEALRDTYIKDVKAKVKTQRAYDSWCTAKNKYLNEVEHVINGVNTTAQLLEQWEECEKFLPKGIVNPSKIALPAVSIAELNKFI